MTSSRYTKFLLLVAGLGGLLYGIDFGVIAVSMPYIKALRYYTDAQVSWIVGAVMFGGILASATAGWLCDRFGRKKMIIFGTSLFLLAVPVICFSGRSLAVMLTGRTLQGMSAGYMAVVMPMYLTECLPPDVRGRGTGVFQMLLCIGHVVSAIVGVAIAQFLGASDSAVADATKDFAWRLNFWWSLLPVGILFVGAFWLKESPVWIEKVKKLRGCGVEKFVQNSPGGAVSTSQHLNSSTSQHLNSSTLFQRKYVIPFLLAVLVLTFNKTIGMSSIIAYSVSLFQKAGLSGSLANVGDFVLKSTNLVMTLVAITLVDRKGRTWLLKVGTGGLTLGLLSIGLFYFAIERGWMTASPTSGFLTLVAFMLMQSFYAIGPGICVWLVLSELMPTRIRANGMAIALFANQFVAWGLASSFFPMTNAWGYGAVFFLFAASGVLYFVTVLFIPETKGKSLDEIENLWSKEK